MSAVTATEANKAIARRFLDEAFNQGRLEVIDEIIAPDAVDHDPAPGQAPGAAGVRQAVSMFRAAFPDLRIELHDQVAQGDLVCNRWTIHGTHQGELMGIPPTGKRVQVPGIDIVRVAQGKLVEHWATLDQVGMLQQLGVMPAPGQG
ncbi:MAG TPA: ester cyclase [Thermomicrobiaceae bacterium]|nr:ester cyclase [Thermomicrobiaceae bacterium]